MNEEPIITPNDWIKEQLADLKTDIKEIKNILIDGNGEGLVYRVKKLEEYQTEMNKKLLSGYKAAIGLAIFGIIFNLLLWVDASRDWIVRHIFNRL